MTTPGDLFKKKSNKVTPGYALGVVLDSNPINGEVGIEIEVEGKRLPPPAAMPSQWKSVTDGSLRGESSEYVLIKPLMFDDVPKALNDLWGVFKTHTTIIDESNRTSVHVHLNFQKFHLTRMTSFCALYFTLEEILTQWCGDHRVGNLFCLRAKDAPAIVSRIKKFIQENGEYTFGDFMKYSGLNPYALRKYGSMEVRTLRGCSEPDVIMSWVAILRRLYELSADYTDPRRVCDLFSGRGPLGFFEEVLGPMASIVRMGVPFTDDEIQDSLYRGIRMAQDLCYCRDWDLYKPVQVKDDPFGRSPKAKKKAMSLTLQAAINEGHAQLAQYQEEPISLDIENLPPPPIGFVAQTLQYTVDSPIFQDGPEEPDF